MSEESQNTAPVFEPPVGEDEKPKKSLRQKISELIKHPLTLLLIGSVIVPLTIYLYNSYKSSFEDKQKRIAEIRNESANVEKEFFSLYTKLAVFQQKNSKIYPQAVLSDEQRIDLRNRQIAFIDEFGKHWEAFSKTYSSEHLWIDKLYIDFPPEAVRKAKLSNGGEKPDEIPENLLKLSKNIEEYRRNFNAGVGVIGDFQSEMIKDSYIPNDRDTKEKIGGFSSITSRYNELAEKRSEVVEKIVQDLEM